jgi:hypothetical protein
VKLENRSTALQPHVKVFSSTKSELVDKYDMTAGANLEFSVAVGAGKDFYVAVLPPTGFTTQPLSRSDYRLSLTVPR